MGLWRVPPLKVLLLVLLQPYLELFLEIHLLQFPFMLLLDFLFFLFLDQLLNEPHLQLLILIALDIEVVALVPDTGDVAEDEALDEGVGEDVGEGLVLEVGLHSHGVLALQGRSVPPPA